MGSNIVLECWRIATMHRARLAEVGVSFASQEQKQSPPVHPSIAVCSVQCALASSFRLAELVSWSSVLASSAWRRDVSADQRPAPSSLSRDCLGCWESEGVMMMSEQCSAAASHVRRHAVTQVTDVTNHHHQQPRHPPPSFRTHSLHTLTGSLTHTSEQKKLSRRKWQK